MSVHGMTKVVDGDFKRPVFSKDGHVFSQKRVCNGAESVNATGE